MIAGGTSSHQTVEFLEALFEPHDKILIRPIETWVEGDKKKTRTLFEATKHISAGTTANGHPPKWRRDQWETIIADYLAKAKDERANLFFSCCPRIGKGFDEAWQIRTVRCLWADIDDAKPPEAIERIAKAGLPPPSIVVSTGRGTHVYWLLAEPWIIDDAPMPPPVKKEWTTGENGKKKVRKFIVVDGEKLYLDIAANRPKLSVKALHVQDILAGIAAKIGGDHTIDVSRLLRIPGTMNRKNERNGATPIPCELVEIDAARRYPLSDFSAFAEASPARQRREQVAKVKLPTIRKPSAKRQDKLQTLALACDVAPVGQRSEADFAFVAYAIENGVAPEVAWLEVQSLGKFAERGREYFDRTWNNAAEQTREKIYEVAQRKAARKARPAGANTNGAASDYSGSSDRRQAEAKPEIEVTFDEQAVADQGISALARMKGVFQRGGRLVHIVTDAKPPKEIRRPPGAPRIVNMPPARLRELLASAAIWFYPPSGDEDEPRRIHPPGWAVEAIYARGEWAGIPPIESVVESPVLRPDGTVLQHAGYDLDSGIYFRPQVQFPQIPDNPSHDDAIKARDELLEIVVDFPFPAPKYRASWLAALLTPFARPAINGCTPLFLIDANTPGCGKGLCVDAISVVANGREISRTTTPPAKDDDEMRKIITAIAVAAEPAILFDNVSGAFGCASLDAALTSVTWSNRILGKSEMTPSLPLAVTWFATGNNIDLVADTPRRVAHIRLESMLEKPSERDGFRHSNLLAWLKEERPRLVGAALTLLRAWFAAGCPSQGLSRWGSFEGWSDIIRQAVVWVGLPDPGDTREEVSSRADGDARLLRQIIRGWESADLNREGMTVRKAIEKASQATDQGVIIFPDLQAAISELTRHGEQPNARSIGRRLQHFRRRVADGKYLDSEDDRGTQVWRIVDATCGSGGSGGSHQAACASAEEIFCNKSAIESFCATPAKPSTPANPTDCPHLRPAWIDGGYVCPDCEAEFPETDIRFCQ